MKNCMGTRGTIIRIGTVDLINQIVTGWKVNLYGKVTFMGGSVVNPTLWGYSLKELKAMEIRQYRNN